MTNVSAKFEDLVSHPHLLAGLKERLAFTAPTQIQVAAIPPILAGRNVFAGAKTGSGKTIAFLVPLAQRILEGKTQKALILAPTRELVLQMDEEADQLLRGQTDVVSVPLFGGVPVDPQALALKVHKPRVLIATPGRMIDLMGEEVLNLSDVDVIVLDEADRMCDMGFAPQVTKIFDLCPNVKQTLFFSATLPEELTTVMEKFCVDPVRIQVDPADQPSETIHHRVIFCNRRNKAEKLLGLIRNSEVTSLIFVRTRNGADRLYRELLDSGETLLLGILHAGYDMPEREATMRAFKEGNIRTLIATDVAARGIDVDLITHVIHYDLPDKFDDYIHRSGRSGRAGRSGTTYALVDQNDREQVQTFEDFSKKISFDGALTEKLKSSSGVPDERSRKPRTHAKRPHYAHKESEEKDRRRSRHGRTQPTQGRHRASRPHEEARRDRSAKPKPNAPKVAAASPVKKITSWIKGLFG